MDPFSSGANLAAMVVKWGFRLILVFSERDSPVAKLVSVSIRKHGCCALILTGTCRFENEQKGTSYHPTLLVQHNSTDPDEDNAISETLAMIQKQSVISPVLAIIPGAEPGVELADKYDP